MVDCCVADDNGLCWTGLTNCLLVGPALCCWSMVTLSTGMPLCASSLCVNMQLWLMRKYAAVG
jgi:hypothetical protein